MKPCILLLLAGSILLAAPRRAAAGDAAAAAKAFADGQRAQVQGDHERAADYFELAHSIEPSKEALRSAIRAHLASGYLARAATLSEELAATYPSDATSLALAGRVLTEAAQKLARVELTCEDACTVSVGGRAVSTARAARHVFFVPAGDQTLSVGFGGRAVSRSLRTAAGARLTVDVRAPAEEPASSAGPASAAVEASVAPAPSPPRRKRGLPRLAPLIGASLTLVSAGAAAWSSFDTRAAHRDYVQAPDHDAWLDGRSKQLRTNILWGVTAGLGVLTAASLYWTNWRPENESSRISLVPTTRDVMLVFSAPL